MSTNLHWSGAHVGEDFFSGTCVLVITKSSIETLLYVKQEERRFSIYSNRTSNPECNWIPMHYEY